MSCISAYSFYCYSEKYIFYKNNNSSSCIWFSFFWCYMTKFFPPKEQRVSSKWISLSESIFPPSLVCLCSWGWRGLVNSINFRNFLKLCWFLEAALRSFPTWWNFSTSEETATLTPNCLRIEGRRVIKHKSSVLMTMTFYYFILFILFASKKDSFCINL